MRSRLPSSALVLLALALLGAACGAESTSDDASVPVIGFVLVGAGDDLGYNQAVREGSEDVARAFPGLDIQVVENVPETEEAGDAMERLIADGAIAIFATSFGYMDEAERVAAENPDVVVVHQTTQEATRQLPNFGTYWGAHDEILSVTGIAAAAATKTGTIGFIVAFPIPTTYINVDALTLGAQRVLPDIDVVVTFTGAWCDPDAQDSAVDRLLSAGADVIALHQDCSRTILERAEADGFGVIGYHADGSEVAPTSWLTGSVWSWSDTYLDIVEAATLGAFTGSPYNSDFRGSLRRGANPAAMTEPGPRVDDDTAAAMRSRLGEFERGQAEVFAGPIADNEGNVLVPAGTSLDQSEVDALDAFVAGVRALDG